MADIDIYISVRQKTDGTYYLHLSDSEGHTGDDNLSTQAAPGDTITWHISTSLTGTTVNIANIYEKDTTNNNNVFSDGPKSKNDGTGNWVGTVDSNINVNENEAYAIDYNVIVNNVTTQHTDDPDIQVITGGGG